MYSRNLVPFPRSGSDVALSSSQKSVSMISSAALRLYNQKLHCKALASFRIMSLPGMRAPVSCWDMRTDIFLPSKPSAPPNSSIVILQNTRIFFILSLNCYRSVEQKRFVVGEAKYTEDMRRLHQLQIRYGIEAEGGNSSARFFQRKFYTYFHIFENSKFAIA